MYETNYHRAESLADAAAKMGGAEDAKYLSGGHTLIPTMKQRLAAPSDLIDLTGIEAMRGIDVDGKKVRIGALTTHAEVNASDALRQVCHSLAEMGGWIGDPAVRHRGTVGGSIANNDPAADYPSAMVALNATIHTDRREVPADEFFTGMFETALEEGEIVTAVSFTAPERCAYEKFRNPASRYAMAGVFIADHGGGNVRVGITGAYSDGVTRHTGMEEALSANFSADAIADAEVDAGELLSDIHGSAEYRANLVKVMAKRAVSKAH